MIVVLISDGMLLSTLTAWEGIPRWIVYSRRDGLESVKCVCCCASACIHWEYVFLSPKSLFEVGSRIRG
jgi:hypothetical protein